MAALLTQQAIDTIKTNSYLKTHVEDVFLNQPWVYDHSVNVAQLATQLALTLHMEEDEALLVSQGALLHDIGRSVTENATTSFILTNDDLIGSSVKHHPIIGSSLLKRAGLPESICLVALQHHERFSGKGYPRGLAHDATHLHAQIVMLADVFEALTTRRLKNKTFEIPKASTLSNADAALIIILTSSMHYCKCCKAADKVKKLTNACISCIGELFCE